MTKAVVSFAMWCMFVCSPGLVLAHDAAMPHHEWFNKHEMNPAARERIGVPWKSCCDNGNVFKIRFRVAADRSDQWEYFKDGEWKVIPPDIIKRKILLIVSRFSSSIRTMVSSSASSCHTAAFEGSSWTKSITGRCSA